VTGEAVTRFRVREQRSERAGLKTSDNTEADMTTQEAHPKLQAPGGGLPWWELLVVRHIIFPRTVRRLTWEAADTLFQDEGKRVLAIWDALPADRLGERILIRRFGGIEDSSRFWSVAMTVEHLNIVGRSLRRVITALRNGQVPDIVARVEDVKPKGEQTPDEVRAEFFHLLADAAIPEPPIACGVGPRYAHPWFGPIDAFRWHCLLGVHQQIHRKQLEGIIVGSKPKS